MGKQFFMRLGFGAANFELISWMTGASLSHPSTLLQHTYFVRQCRESPEHMPFHVATAARTAIGTLIGKADTMIHSQ